MPDGDEILDDITFEEKLADMKTNGTLPEFTARTVWKMQKNCEACMGNSFSKKQSTTISTIISAIFAGVVVLINGVRGGN